MIPYYSGNIYDSVVKGHLTIEQWIFAHHSPKQHVVEILNEVAKCRDDHDKKQKLKTKLYYITPSVHILKGNKRQYSNIEYFTGYAQLDFDKLNSIAEAEELKTYLFNQFDCLKCVYLSPSRLGVKAIIRIPMCKDVEEYKDYYKAIETEMVQHSSNFDHAPFNCVLPLFINVDKTILSRKVPIVWDVKEDRTIDYSHLNAVESEWGRQRDHMTKSLFTVTHFKDKMTAIVDGDGHPRLRSACLVLGSRAGAGYIDVQQAEELMDYMIETNPYLRHKLNTYLKTAHWCLKQGFMNPSYY